MRLGPARGPSRLAHSVRARRSAQTPGHAAADALGMTRTPIGIGQQPLDSWTAPMHLHIESDEARRWPHLPSTTPMRAHARQAAKKAAESPTSEHLARSSAGPRLLNRRGLSLLSESLARGSRPRRPPEASALAKVDAAEQPSASTGLQAHARIMVSQPSGSLRHLLVTGDELLDLCSLWLEQRFFEALGHVLHDSAQWLQRFQNSLRSVGWQDHLHPSAHQIMQLLLPLRGNAHPVGAVFIGARHGNA
ncbi:hypothetical protein FQA39_LY18816 [Lamprigera yunnana]|nr:hypothetical protein FQA39_LY18816 [Lamprigera yunnana]